MKFGKRLALLALLVLPGCQTFQQAREIHLLGFSDDVSKGKNIGPVEGSDCVYQVLGYWLGGQPTLSRAVMNARSGKKGSIGEAVASEGGTGEGGVRYFNNMTMSHDGFNAGVFGKYCILITGTGFR